MSGAETIQFAWGTTTLGNIIVAASHKGLVAIEFSSDRLGMEVALRARFPDAAMVLAQDELDATVAKVVRAIEEPGFDPDLELDPRGTPYEIHVWSMLGEIPTGETTNYGTLALQLGTKDARDVTAAIANNAIAVLIPCHRVIKKDGTLSGYRWGFKRKRELLRREGAVTQASGSSAQGTLKL